MNVRELNRATLARQMLLAREKIGVVEAVERLGGLQAQEPKPPFLALWSRLSGFAPDDLRAALASGELVRAMMMRATLHTVSASDFARLRPALQPVMDAAMNGALRGRDDGYEVDAVVRAATASVRKKARTFGELRAILAEQFPSANDRALGYTVRTQLPLVMVPELDQRWSFPRDARFGPAPEIRKPDVEHLVRRHLGAFGPATVADVQAWCGLKGLKEVVGGMDDLERIDGKLLDLPGAPRPDAGVEAPARFLPEFDSLLLAHKDRTRIVADEHRAGLVTKNLRVRAVFLHDGFAAGTWEVKATKKLATMTLHPFAKLPREARTPLVEEGERLLRFAEPDAADVRVEIA
ncbi:MAG: hypothetical protein AVDCRST_MAG85-2754 [uncultured Solirubrobacteraceae bacterium]|uniref:Winged helix DNA-binding domain-containing protein n=1 Tax=uncultured Solirubrobacteraceae bacterium TaxID=1162706 RepID=A0A6J4TC54_9ACTN|nr:MAG: hypothetical protein AVDCRST_MAG85-2754 [uncultured Solirubrobacteraceae bacterium]